MKVSIVIPTLNHLEDCLKPCIEAIKQYVDLTDKEVIIVANGCTDGTRAYVESLGEPFKLLWFDKPTGFAKPNNDGVRVAQGEYILFLNNDCFFQKEGVIELLLNELETNSDVGIAGPDYGYNEYAGRNYLKFYCVMMRKSLYDEFGGLDEAFKDGTRSEEHTSELQSLS